jgi:hypothetical protein
MREDRERLSALHAKDGQFDQENRQNSRPAQYKALLSRDLGRPNTREAPSLLLPAAPR